MRLGGYAEIFWRNVRASGVIPQLSVIMGPCAGGAVYSPAMTDFTFMVDEISPDVHHRPRRHQDRDRRGGHPRGARWRDHPQQRSGVAHFVGHSEQASCSRWCAAALSTCPPTTSTRRRSRRPRRPARGRRGAGHDRPRPIQPRLRHDSMSSTRSSTTASSSRSQPLCAQNIVMGFAGWTARRRGRRQPAQVPGRVLDIDASIKARPLRALLRRLQHPAGHVRRRPGLPAGHRPGVRRHHPHGSKLLYAYCEATVPKLTVITRKAYGGAYDVMNSQVVRSDLQRRLAHGEIAVMGPEGAVNIVFRRELTPPQARRRRPARAAHRRVQGAVRQPVLAAGRGYVDAVIHPRETRAWLIRALETSLTKRVTRPPKRKHGNIPLSPPRSASCRAPAIGPSGAARRAGGRRRRAAGRRAGGGADPQPPAYRSRWRRAASAEGVANRRRP